jgi:hypothetical protein
MEYNYPSGQGTATSPNQASAQPEQAQQQGTTRGRGRRQYAAQQYDFSSPAPAVYGQEHQQPQYPAQGYPQGQPAHVAQASYGQPQAYSQPGYQYGQEYQQPSPTMYQQGYQGQAGVNGVTKQFQNLEVTRVRTLYSPSHISLLLQILLSLLI